MSRRIVAITAGLSNPSSTRLLTDRLTAAVSARVGNRGETADIETIELRELADDLLKMFTTGIPSTKLQEAHDKVSSADGLIAVTPVFTASYSGLFKMFWDSIGTDALNGLPVLIAATAGTARHALVLDYAMRPLFTYLRAVVVPTGVFAATDDFGTHDGANEAPLSLDKRIARAADELTALVVSESGSVGGFLQNESARPRTTGHSVGAVADFSTLMAGLGR